MVHPLQYSTSYPNRLSMLRAGDRIIVFRSVLDEDNRTVHIPFYKDNKWPPLRRRMVYGFRVKQIK